MATAISADGTTMSQLINAIAELAPQLNAKSNEIIALKTQLRRSHSQHSNNNNHGGSQSTMLTNGKHHLNCGGYSYTRASCNTLTKEGRKNEATR